MALDKHGKVEIKNRISSGEQLGKQSTKHSKKKDVERDK